MSKKYKQMWVDPEFYDLFKESGYPGTSFTKNLAKQLKNKKKNDFDEVFRI